VFSASRPYAASAASYHFEELHRIRRSVAGMVPARRHAHAFQCDTPALIRSAPMPFPTPIRHPAAVRGGLCAGRGAVVREIWPYKPVAHSSARR